MTQELMKKLDEILFQLHVISSQNFLTLIGKEGEDDSSESIRRYATIGFEREKKWMEDYVKKMEEG